MEGEHQIKRIKSNNYTVPINEQSNVGNDELSIVENDEQEVEENNYDGNGLREMADDEKEPINSTPFLFYDILYNYENNAFYNIMTGEVICVTDVSNFIAQKEYEYLQSKQKDEQPSESENTGFLNLVSSSVQNIAEGVSSRISSGSQSFDDLTSELSDDDSISELNDDELDEMKNKIYEFRNILDRYYAINSQKINKLIHAVDTFEFILERDEYEQSLEYNIRNELNMSIVSSLDEISSEREQKIAILAIINSVATSGEQEKFYENFNFDDFDLHDIITVSYTHLTLPTKA